MKITQKGNCSLQVDVGKQNIDQPIGKHLENTPFPNSCSTLAIIGTQGSGKSSLLTSILTSKKNKIFHKSFEKVFICVPSECCQSESDSHVYNTHPTHRLSQDFLDMVIEHCRKEKEEKPNHKTMLIIDDYTEQLVEYENSLRLLINKHRHLNLQICISCLNIKRGIPRCLRPLIRTYIFVGRPRLLEQPIIREELLSMKPDDTKHLFDYIYNDNCHNFLLLDTKENKIYKNFTLLDINI